MQTDEGEAGITPDLAAGLAELPPEQRASLAEAAACFAGLSPAERAAVRDAARDELLDHQAEQVVEASVDATRRGRAPALLPRLAEAAAADSAGHDAGSPEWELAQFILAVSALLSGRPVPPVPRRFAHRYADLIGLLSENDA